MIGEASLDINKADSQHTRRLKVCSNLDSWNFVRQLELIRVDVRADSHQGDIADSIGLDVREGGAVCIRTIAERNGDLIDDRRLDLFQAELGNALVQVRGELVARVL